MKSTHPELSSLALPGSWPAQVKTSLISAISMAHSALVHACGWAAESVNPRLRSAAELQQAQAQIALLREEIRIKDARMQAVPAQRRPHYPPVERMAILELRAAQGWSLAQAARVFLITPATIADWLKRLDDSGNGGLVQLRQPVNRFPDFVRLLVQRLKVLCPLMGKAKLAGILARAGLHLGVTTVGRILKESAPREGKNAPVQTDANALNAEADEEPRIVTAKHPNHALHVDLNAVPTAAGFAVPWLPHSVVQRWPFCWWVAVAIDHFSRRIMGLAIFDRQPTSLQVRQFLAVAIGKAGQVPKHIICDKGGQFWCDGFKDWCRRRGINPRFGAVGKKGSIAVVERFIRTMKAEGTWRLLQVPLRKESFRQELNLFADWYNEHRPHTWFGGCTPEEAYRGYQRR